jgi:hypothetical protein
MYNCGQFINKSSEARITIDHVPDGSVLVDGYEASADWCKRMKKELTITLTDRSGGSMQYHKIQSLFKREPDGKRMLFGMHSKPEFEYLADNEWLFNEKIDGMNMRATLGDKLFSFAGKTDNAQIPPKLLCRMHELFSFEGKTQRFQEEFKPGVVFYGEGYGPGIQKGACYGKEQDFILFDILIGEQWLSQADVRGIGEKFGIKVAPQVGVGNLKGLIYTVEQNKFSILLDGAACEGIVARPKTELRNTFGERVITKLKHKDFSNAISVGESTPATVG